MLGEFLLSQRRIAKLGPRFVVTRQVSQLLQTASVFLDTSARQAKQPSSLSMSLSSLPPLLGCLQVLGLKSQLLCGLHIAPFFPSFFSYFQ